MTWSAWVNASGNPTDDGNIIAKGNNTSGWQLKTSPDTGPETFCIALSVNSNSYTGRYSKTVRALNTWYYVAGVYNATAQTLDIYVNGVVDDSILDGTIPSSQYAPSVDVNIGRRSTGYYFKGIIDEVRIYNRALTQSEIQNDMITPISVALARSSALIDSIDQNLSKSINSVGLVPKNFSLGQNYPNPFNPTTNIEYGLPWSTHVTLDLYNSLGQLVRHLVDETQDAGYHQVKVDCRQISSGIYFYRFQAGEFTETKKLLLLK